MSILSFFRKRKPDRELELTAVCMILSWREEPPGDEAVRSAFRVFPEGSCVQRSDGIWELSLPGVERAAVSFIPEPVRDGPAEARHRSHAVVACRTTRGGRLEASLLLTAMVRALLDPFEGTAVWWPAGSVTVSRQRFERAAASATREQLPLELWCRFHVDRIDDEHRGLHTVGMRQFGTMEIEVERSSWQPRDLSDFVKKVASAILTSGAAVKDGDTIGNDAEQKIVVRHGRSSLTGHDVYKVLTP